MSRLSVKPVRQRRDLTFKHNTTLGRHGWLRLTPAYSVKVVEDILDSVPEASTVLDPFSGSATTPLAAAYRGKQAIAVDINPFLAWFGRLKIRKYGRSAITGAERALEHAVTLLETVEPAPAPPLFNIARWWGRDELLFLRRLRAAIGASSPGGRTARDLLSVAFCRTLMALSNAAFNHQSMSFKRTPIRVRRRPAAARFVERFLADVAVVLDGARENPEGKATVRLGDSRLLAEIEPGSFDLVVTSPPYPNRMSYIRELRPYMYWLDFLDESREAGDLDWRAIGGTWGVATSRLSDYRLPDAAQLPRSVARSARSIRRSGARNASLLATYVEKYFYDAFEHLTAMAARLGSGGRVHYVVGNSSFYGVLVETERAYAEMLASLGFCRVETRVLRKRNSNKALFEFDVSAFKAPGLT